MTMENASRRRRRRTALNVVVKVPKHSSSVQWWMEHEEKARSAATRSVFTLYCRQPGVLWHGLYPMLFEANNRRIPRRLVKLVFASSWRNSTAFRRSLKQILEEGQSSGHDNECNNEEIVSDDHPFYCRTVPISLSINNSPQTDNQTPASGTSTPG